MRTKIIRTIEQFIYNFAKEVPSHVKFCRWNYNVAWLALFVVQFK